MNPIENTQPIPQRIALIIGSVLAALFCIAGCSEAPYDRTMLLAKKTQELRISQSNGLICLHDGSDTSCFRVGPQTDNAPIIHVHPRKIVYVFRYEEKSILRAEWAMDTSDIAARLTDTGAGGRSGGDDSTPPIGNPPGNNPSNDGNNDRDNGNTLPSTPPNNRDDGDNGGGNGKNPSGDHTPTYEGWIIQIYYPDRADVRLPANLATSGLTIRLNGQRIADADIKGFETFSGSGGEKGIQFVYPSKSSAFVGLTVDITGLTNPDETVTFNIIPVV